MIAHQLNTRCGRPIRAQLEVPGLIAMEPLVAHGLEERELGVMAWVLHTWNANEEFLLIGAHQ